MQLSVPYYDIRQLTIETPFSGNKEYAPLENTETLSLFTVLFFSCGQKPTQTRRHKIIHIGKECGIVNCLNSNRQLRVTTPHHKQTRSEVTPCALQRKFA